MGNNLVAGRLVEGLQGSLLQIDVSQIVVHDGDEPNALVDFLDAELLPGEHGRDAELPAMHADAPAGGDEQVSGAPTPPVAVLLQNRTGAELRELHRAGYWSSVQAESVVVSLIAGAAGAIVTSARLTVLSLA